MSADLIISDPIPPGTFVMLADNSPAELILLVGVAAVLSVLFQDGADLATNADGDLIGTRTYCLQHQHRGRLVHRVSERFLAVVERDAAKGQILIHAEMTRDLVAVLKGLISND